MARSDSIPPPSGNHSERMRRGNNPRMEIAVTKETIDDPNFDPNLRAFLISTAESEQREYDARQAAEARAETATQQVLTDALTGLGSRVALQQKMGQAFEQVSGRDGASGNKRRKKSGAISVGFVDANDFGPINKTFGDARGDIAIRLIGEFFHPQTGIGKLRPGDFVARKGGDEFVVLMQSDEDDARKRLAGLKREFTESVSAKFEAEARPTMQEERDIEIERRKREPHPDDAEKPLPPTYDEALEAYRKSMVAKYDNPMQATKPLAISYSVGVKQLSKEEVLGLDTADHQAIGRKIVQILSASDKAQHADKDAHRAAMRAWPKESKAHELVCEKPSTIKRQ